jgi:hypothetical protein
MFSELKKKGGGNKLIVFRLKLRRKRQEMRHKRDAKLE